MTTTDREQVVIRLDAWLGDARADLTDEQYARLLDESIDIEARYPDPDDADDARDALTAAVQYALGEIDPTRAGAALVDARAAARTALVAAQQVARMAVQDGMSEARAAEQCGIDRMTVRKVLGKR